MYYICFLIHTIYIFDFRIQRYIKIGFFSDFLHKVNKKVKAIYSLRGLKVVDVESRHNLMYNVGLVSQ